jgi:hypothetical protein
LLQKKEEGPHQSLIMTLSSGSQNFYDLASSKDKILKLYEGAFHDLLNDSDKEIVMTDIRHWIDERIAKASRAPSQGSSSGS